ncbi:hypothetical protein E4U53_001140 [Claviceps sorghi]|nr:hypothetical protein E4U53_001140 [Claviceps sorghi]
MRFKLLALALATSVAAFVDDCRGSRCCQCTWRGLNDDGHTGCVSGQVGAQRKYFDVLHGRGYYFCKFSASEDKVEQKCLGKGRCKRNGQLRGHRCWNC